MISSSFFKGAICIMKFLLALSENQNIWHGSYPLKNSMQTGSFYQVLKP